MNSRWTANSSQQRGNTKFLLLVILIVVAGVAQLLRTRSVQDTGEGRSVAVDMGILPESNKWRTVSQNPAYRLRKGGLISLKEGTKEHKKATDGWQRAIVGAQFGLLGMPFNRGIQQDVYFPNGDLEKRIVKWTHVGHGCEVFVEYSPSWTPIKDHSQCY